MKNILIILIFSCAVYAEEAILLESDILVKGGIPVEKMMGRKFKGIATVEIVRSTPLVYFGAPMMEHEKNGRTAHLISIAPESYFEKIQVGTKIEIESMIVDQGYGAIMMYVYSMKILP